MSEATSTIRALYEAAFRSGLPFEEFLHQAEAHRDLWHAFALRSPEFPEAARRIGSVDGCWRLLVLTDDWCGDGINTLPIMARLADSAGNVSLRVVPRDAYPQIRDRHLTNGSRSIPIAILLGENGNPHGWWGPRPGPLQSLFETHLRDLPGEQRYREIRRWYARDRGITTAEEIVALFERAGAEVEADVAGSSPCDEVWAA